jgi:hypothetical protein
MINKQQSPDFMIHRIVFVTGLVALCFPSDITGQNGVALGQAAAPSAPARATRAKVASGAATPASPADRATIVPQPESPALPADAATVATATPKADSPRLTKLKTLTYDRRPSAILRAWSEPAEKPDEGAAAEAAKPAARTDSIDDDGDDDDDEIAVPAQPQNLNPANAAAAQAAAATQTPEMKALDAELKTLQRNVTLGRWADVKTYLAGLPEIEGKEGYAQLLKGFGPAPGTPQAMQLQQQRNAGIVPEQHVFALDDVMGLAAACPHKLERPTVQALAPMLQIAIQAGVLPQSVVARLEHEAARPAGETPMNRTQCAWFLVAANMTEEIERFLPSRNEALEQKDAESLILLARCFSAKYDRDKKPQTIEESWTLLVPVLTLPEAKPPQRDEALKMLIGLVPKVRDGLGQAWLEQNFAGEPQFGMKILAATGTAAAGSFMQNIHNPAERLRELRIQKKIVDALLEKSPERAAEWQDVLRVLAMAWLREAEITRNLDRSTMYGPRMRRDMFGNMFYFDEDGGMQMRQQNNQVQPIGSVDILDISPGETWMARLEDSLVPKFLALHAQLYLKVSEDERAYPYIERLAASQPTLARDLIHEFIRTWTRNHDLNANQRYTNPYMYMYGFEMRSNSIPLTRSKQERNLDDLAGWVARIRKLPIKDLDESLLAKAFTTCHSTAEVYRIDALEKVFGAIDALDAKTLAQIVQQMRGNLTGIWRMPAQQEQQKTQRKQKDIEAEVLRGYRVANTVADRGLVKYPEDWRLRLAQACLALDQNTYKHQIAPSSKFTEERTAALVQIRQAADQYAKQVPTLPEADQECTVYEHWFYAGLGASDLGQIDHRATADPRQPALIREAMAALPGEAAEKHLSMFANALFTRMSALKPNVKFPYLKAGFEIVGDHKQAREARRVYDYYKDLVSEIKLVTRVDGSAKVGHDAAFGVFVELRHTPEIERESGGFGKYLQNQNSMTFAWNYGRPLENYRDKFDEAIRAALQEHFEVLSVTFQEKDVHSRASAEAGWRTTPYAYLLVKARGPQIDKLPSLKIDLDFLDTSGYTVLPVTSPALPIDAVPDTPDRRPYEKLQITQTLDERQSKDGKLILEVKAKARGLVPPLEEFVDVRASDFEVQKTEDEEVKVSRFDPESGEPAIISERTFTITYAGRQDLAELPKEFRFPEPKVEVAENSYMRYEDADLKTVESTVSLEQKYGEVRQVWPWYVAGGIPVLIAIGLGYRAVSKRRKTPLAEGVKLPESLTPFYVLALLRKIEAKNGFDVRTKDELTASIQNLERFYFAGVNGQTPPDLQQLAKRWVSRAK